MKSSSPIQGITKDCTLQYNSLIREYYLLKPFELNIDSKHSVNKKDVISLDPGVRTFQTGYEVSGETVGFVEISTNFLKKDLENIDNEENKRKKDKLRQRLKNKIDDLHWKTCGFLCKNYNNVIIGNMSTTGIAKNLCNKVNRDLYILSHFTFRQRLEQKCREHGVRFICTNEAYTSKTCYKCGEINKTLGANKVFTCGKCKQIVDRDLNGAVNIFLKTHNAFRFYA
jgi:putative transposase